jgi:hypothetical protein
VTLLRRIATVSLGLAVGACPLLTDAASRTSVPDDRVAKAAAEPRIDLHRWLSTAGWRAGVDQGLSVEAGRIAIDDPVASRSYHDKRYDVSRWTSPWVETGFGASQLIPSWNGTTPAGTWIEVAVRASRGDEAGSWDVVANWADGDGGFSRVSLGEQGDDLVSLNVDTLVTNSTRGLASWQLRLSLMRLAGTDRTPVVTSAGIMTSAIPTGDRPTSRTSMRDTVDLKVPRYSQMLHAGTYPQWDNGGEAWCSPTSTTMLLAFWKSLPSERATQWIDDDRPQKPVIHAARHVYDYRYDGAGNWPFNTAYAGTLGLDAYVTRLRSLREAERYIRNGIPLAASVAFDSGELDGAPINSTNGHLMVIRGFTAAGDVIVNDPAAPSRSSVRRTYDRGQFENAWIPATGGVVYVMRPPGTPLP